MHNADQGSVAFISPPCFCLRLPLLLSRNLDEEDKTHKPSRRGGVRPPGHGLPVRHISFVRHVEILGICFCRRFYCIDRVLTSISCPTCWAGDLARWDLQRKTDECSLKSQSGHLAVIVPYLPMTKPSWNGGSFGGKTEGCPSFYGLLVLGCNPTRRSKAGCTRSTQVTTAVPCTSLRT